MEQRFLSSHSEKPLSSFVKGGVVLIALAMGAFFVTPHSAHAAATELYHTAFIQDSSLVSYYRLEGNSNDAKGSNDGTDTAVTYGTSTAKFGEAAGLQSASSSGIVLPALGIVGSHAFSVSLWFYSSSTTTNALLFNLGGDSGCYNSPLMMLNDNNGGSHSLSLNWGCGHDVYTTSSLWTDSAWHNVVFTYSGGDISNSKIYLDGTVQTSTVAGSGTPYWNNGDSNIGNGLGGSGYYTGYLDDIAVFNRALDSTEVSQIYNGGLYLAFLSQLHLDGTTPISGGGITSEDGVILRAALSEDASSSLWLEAEVTSTGNSFSNSANVSSPHVSSGEIATTSFSSSNGDYHWQARVVDSNGSTSAWQTFGVDATSTVDFTIDYTPGASATELYFTSLYVDPNLVSYYRLEGNSNDAKGSNDGTDTAVTYGTSTAKFGEAAGLQSASSSGIVLPPLGISGNAAFSVSLWFYSSSTTTNALLFNLGGDSGCSNSPLMMLNDNNGGTGSLSLNFGCGTDVYTASNAWTTNMWHQVVFTFSGGGVSNAKVYLDGTQLTTTVAGSGSPSWNNGNSNIGNGLGGSGYYTGYLDDIAVFNRVLSSTEVSELFDGTLPPITSYYAVISNTSNGRWLLRSTPATSTMDNLLERLPQDWIVYVSSTSNATTSGGYTWYNVIDPTDNVDGWMAASSSDGTVYLPYPTSTGQGNLASIASSTLANESDRAAEVFDAVDHYYNNASTTASLYSSDNGLSELSMFSNGVLGGNTYSTFPEQIILGMAIQEDGHPSYDFDNEIVSFDYGHGVMQLTPYQVFSHEPTSTGDWQYNTENVPANGSFVEIFPCRSYDEFNDVGTSTYVNCYTYSGTHDSVDSKSYQPYGGIAGQTEYKWYGNTAQSIYANIKDGMRRLQDKYYFSPITTSTVVNSTTYTGQEREIILATQAYNGVNDTGCGYVNAVASSTDSVDQYFSGQTTSSIADILQKMHIAGQDVVCAQLLSPATLSIQDSSGRKVGIVNGQGRNDFPLAVYDPAGKWADILAAGNGNYRYKVTGAGNGTYGFNLTIKRGDQSIVFRARNMPIVPGQIDTYTVDSNAIFSGQSGVTVETDLKGDGTINKVETLPGASVMNSFSANEPATPTANPSIPINPPDVLFGPKPTTIIPSLPAPAAPTATPITTTTILVAPSLTSTSTSSSTNQ